MLDQIAIAISDNLLSPMVLCFALGFGAARAGSELEFPAAFSKALSIYLLFAIGFKGGASLATQTIDSTLLAVLMFAMALSAFLPLPAYALLRFFAKQPPDVAAATAAHYGSISIVTFVAATQFVEARGLSYEGYLAAAAAMMETPAIVTGLLLYRGGKSEAGGSFWTEVLLNGSVVLLLGAFLVGLLTGTEGLHSVAPLIKEPFKGVLCLFLLDMGILAARRFVTSELSWRLVLFAFVMPWLGAIPALGAAWALGLSVGGATVLAVLGASASYIAVPAAMRLAIPSASPSIYITLSLGLTFPFNLALGIPLYHTCAYVLWGVS